ncbi:MAG: hypothetical protein WC378_04625 [Opitutaceae bacterium]|jgi:hypothetical protein
MRFDKPPLSIPDPLAKLKGRGLHVSDDVAGRRLLRVIGKAKIACANAGQRAADHFADAGKMISLAKGAQREVVDVALTHSDEIQGNDLHGEMQIATTFK